VAELDDDSRMALFALTVNTVKLPWERRSRTTATADKQAEAVSLDMTGYLRPTVRSYLGRITMARILEAVREAVSDEAADRMAQMKKQDMAEAAEQLLAATGWLPALMRTPRAAQGSTESPQPDAVTEAKDTEAYFVAAEWMAKPGRLARCRPYRGAIKNFGRALGGARHLHGSRLSTEFIFNNEWSGLHLR
jgi:ParB family chromosome partitioning protein